MCDGRTGLMHHTCMNAHVDEITQIMTQTHGLLCCGRVLYYSITLRHKCG